MYVKYAKNDEIEETLFFDKTIGYVKEVLPYTIIKCKKFSFSYDIFIGDLYENTEQDLIKSLKEIGRKL